MLQKFIKNNPYANQRLGQARMISPLKGYPLRSRMSSVIPVDDNILVVGEAAGLVNPLNGEGIGTAMLSGELAAQHAQTALDNGDFSKLQLNGYAQALHQNIGRNHFFAKILQKVIGRPGVMNRTVQRARHDRHFAQRLFEVIVEVKPPSVTFSPGFIARLIAG
jgi:flavin-dependent dehydrogenase